MHVSFMVELAERGRYLAKDAVMAHFYGAWYPAHVTTVHSEGGEVEVLWDGEFTRSLLPVSDVRHFHSEIVRQSGEIYAVLHRIRTKVFAYVQRVYKVCINCSSFGSNCVTGETESVERGRFFAADAVMAHFYGAWYPARVSAVHNEGLEIEVLWDGEFTYSILPVNDVRHFHSETVHDINEIDTVLHHIQFQILAYVQRRCRVFISCSPFSSNRLDGGTSVDSDEKATIPNNVEEGPSGTVVHMQIDDQYQTEQSGTVGTEGDRVRGTGETNARSASSDAQSSYVEAPLLSTQPAQAAAKQERR